MLTEICQRGRLTTRFTPRSVACFAVTCSLVAALSGCGSKLPVVVGTVTMGDAPLPNARVVFEAPDRPMAVATTDDAGRYDVMTGSQRGMAAGSYDVAISAFVTKNGGSESPLPILSTPKRYNSARTSGLTAVVKEGRNEGVNFQLERQ